VREPQRIGGLQTPEQQRPTAAEEQEDGDVPKQDDQREDPSAAEANLYGYATSTPVTGVDPDGNWGEKLCYCGGGGGIGGSVGSIGGGSEIVRGESGSIGGELPARSIPRVTTVTGQEVTSYSEHALEQALKRPLEVGLGRGGATEYISDQTQPLS